MEASQSPSSKLENLYKTKITQQTGYTVHLVTIHTLIMKLCVKLSGPSDKDKCSVQV